MRAGVALGVVLLVALAACAAPDAPAGDAGAPSVVDAAAPAPIAAPVPPELGDDWVCPPGWTSARVAEGPAPCAPWPAADAPDCADGEARFVGEARCAPLSVCPAGRFPDAPPGAIHVDPAAPPGGDGTPAAPLASLAEAIAIAGDGDTVALSAGDFEGPFEWPAGVNLQGACAGATRLVSGPGDALEATVRLRAGEASLRDVTIAGPRVGVWVNAGASVTLERVEVRGAVLYGVAIAGRFRARDLVIRATDGLTDGPTSGAGGYAILVEGGDAEIDRVVATDSQEIGVLVARDGVLALRDARVAGTRPSAIDPHRMGVGVVAALGGALTLQRAVVEDNRRSGVEAQGEGVHIVAKDTVIRGTRATTPPDPDAPPLGRAIAADAGAAATLARVWLDANPSGVRVFAGASVDAADLRIDASTGLDARGVAGVALWAAEGSIRGRRVAVRGSADVAARAAGAGGSLVLEDAWIVDTPGAWDPAGPSPDQSTGLAVHVLGSAVGELRRTRIERATGIAVGVAGTGSVLDVEDLEIQDTASGPYEGILGRALVAAAEGTLRGARVRSARNREVAVSAWLPGSVIALRDLTVEDTLAARCGEAACEGRGGGIGVGAYSGGHLDLERFEVARSALAGVQLAHGAASAEPPYVRHPRGGTASFRHGRLVDCPFALDAQSDDAVAAELIAGLTFVGNEVNVVGHALPVPTPGE